MIRAAVALMALAMALPAAAKGGVSFSAPRSVSVSRPYVAPRMPTPAPAPRPVVVNKTVVNKTTVVQHNSTQAASSSGGFFSSIFPFLAGAAVGTVVTNAVNDKKPEQAVAPQQPASAPVQK